MLNTMKVNKQLTDGNYTATLTGYTQNLTNVSFNFSIDEATFTTVYDFEVKKGDETWSPLQRTLDAFGTYVYNPAPIEMLDTIIKEATPIKVTLKKGKYIKVLGNYETSVPTEDEATPVATPSRKQRA